MGLCPELSQYTYYMLRQGVDTYVLRTLTEQELQEECGICNSIHRRKIMQNLGGEIWSDLSGTIGISSGVALFFVGNMMVVTMLILI